MLLMLLCQWLLKACSKLPPSLISGSLWTLCAQMGKKSDVVGEHPLQVQVTTFPPSTVYPGPLFLVFHLW